MQIYKLICVPSNVEYFFNLEHLKKSGNKIIITKLLPQSLGGINKSGYVEYTGRFILQKKVDGNWTTIDSNLDDKKLKGNIVKKLFYLVFIAGIGFAIWKFINKSKTK